MTERVRITVEDGVATVTLSRPEKRNAVDWDMLRAWIAAQKQLGNDRSLRAVVLKGDGPSFCAGLDFPTFMRQPARILQGFLQPGGNGANLFQQACLGWRSLPVPVAAVIHGHCYGAGLQLALACDFRFAHPDSELSIMEIKWGLVPDMSGTITLRELVPMDLAKRLCMTGEVFSAEQALNWQLVSEVSDNPDAAARQLLQKIATRSPDAVAGCKFLLQESWDAEDKRCLALERRWQRRMLSGSNQRVALKHDSKSGAVPVFGPRQRGL